MLKILHVGKYYYPELGGMETVLKLLCEGLTLQGNQVTVVCSATSRRSSEEKIQEVRVIRLARLLELFGQAINPQLFFKIRRLAKEHDIIHVHSPNPLVELCVLFLPKDIPIVMTHHSDVVRQKILKIFYKPLFKMFLKRVKKIIIPTENHLKYSDTLPEYKAKCAFASFGIKTKEYALDEKIDEMAKIKITENGDFILFVGRLVPYKGLSVLIDAMREIDAKLVIVGDGPLYSELRAQSIMKDVSEKIIFKGSVKNNKELISYYHACQLFVLPSVGRNENFGMVQLEAMICKKPVVATNLETGVPCVGIPGETTLLVKPGDSSDLSKNINRILKDKKLKIKMGEKAYDLALHKYDWTMMVKEYHEIYCDVKNG